MRDVELALVLLALGFAVLAHLDMLAGWLQARFGGRHV